MTFVLELLVLFGVFLLKTSCLVLFCICFRALFGFVACVISCLVVVCLHCC